MKKACLIGCAALLLVLAAAGPATANTVDLDQLTPARVGLVIGGNRISGGQGFLHNFRYLTEAQLKDIQNNGSGEYTYKYGLGDSYIESPALYSVYENHGTPTWGYRCVAGLDLRLLAEALGIDTSQKLSLEVKGADGMSKVIPDAFGAEVKRYVYDAHGRISREIGPALALYESGNEIYTAPSPEAPAALPRPPQTGAGSSDAVSPTFAYGQTSPTDSNNCNWVKYVDKLRIGPEDVALTVATDSGRKVTTSISEIVRLGVYSAGYSFSEAGASIAHLAYGLPLTALLDSLGVSVDAGQSIRAYGLTGQSRDFSAAAAAAVFCAWDAQQNGSSVGNATALRLYCGGDTAGEMIFADLTAFTIVAGERPAAPDSARPDFRSAVATSQSVSFNGQAVALEVYNIDGSNYFKLRDIAALVDGSADQFSVTVDPAAKYMTAMVGEPYIPVGGELATGGDQSASCVASPWKLEVKGGQVDVAFEGAPVYHIGGNNFFKLRDLAAVFGFNVAYDEAGRMVRITASDYQPAS